MTLPASIRVNTRVPFPTLIYGGAPVTISKVNGIWTVGLSVDSLGRQTPTSPNFPTDYLLVWDSLAKTYFKLTLFDLAAAITITPNIPIQRLATSSPVGVNSNDQIINLNIGTGSPTCTLPAAASRLGAKVTFKDVGGHWATNNMTFSCTGGELIDGQATVVGSTAYGAYTFVPANDGTTTGWSIE